MSTYIPPYGSEVLAQAPVPPNPAIRSIVIGQLEASDRYNAAAPSTELKVNAIQPPAGSVRREYIVSDDQTFAVGNTVRINMVLSGADQIYLDELAVMFRDAGGTDREALIDADANHDRLKAANTDLLISVGWQVVDGAPTTPTVTIHPWTFAGAADVVAALTGTEPTGKGGHVVTLQAIYDTRSTIVQATEEWTEGAAGIVQRASPSEAQATSSHSNEKGLSVLRGWQQVGAWWGALSKVSLRNKLGMATAQQARAGTGDGVMTAELVSEAVTALTPPGTAIASLSQAQAAQAQASNAVLMSPRRVWDWWTGAITKLLLRTKLGMATAQQARAGSGDGVMTSELTSEAITALAPAPATADLGVSGTVVLASTSEVEEALAGNDPPLDIQNKVITLQRVFDRLRTFVATETAALVDSAPGTLNTLNELAAALDDDPNFATTIMNLLGLKANIASPTLTGDPHAPTPAAGDDDTSIATTEFVQRSLRRLGPRRANIRC